MKSNINYKDTLFKRSNLTPIRGKPTFEKIHKLRNEIKANTNSVYSNFGGGAHDHLGLVLNDAKYVVTSPTTFVNLIRPSPLIILDGTTDQSNSNMRIAHTEEVRLLSEVTWLEQDLLQ